MSHPAAIPTPPAGRTFTVAMGAIGMLLAVMVVATLWAVVRHLNLPAELPSKPSANDFQNGQNGGQSGLAGAPPLLPADMLPSGAVPEILDGNLVQPARVSPAPMDLLPENRPGAILDLEVLELVEVAAAQRRDGDTAGALKRLREADTRLPAQPRVMWEMAEVFAALGLTEKRNEQLSKVIALGELNAGEFYQLARLASDSANSDQRIQRRPELAFGETLTTANPEATDGERILVRLAIHSNVASPVPPEQVEMTMDFYDLVDGSRIEETRSNQPIASWPTAPVHWTAAGTEIVEWEYHMPVLDSRERAAFGERRYYGFVAKLYRNDTLQDIYAEPRTLLARSQAGAGSESMLDASLFPSGN